MLELKVNKDLICWTKSFLMNQKFELIIDSHINSENNIETRVLQGSLVSPIFFLIYISGVFNQIGKKLPKIVFLLFVDDLSFIDLGFSI